MSRLPRISSQDAIRSLVVAIAYFCAGWFGITAFAVAPKITLVWLPTGIAIGALLRWGNGCAAGIFFGQLAIFLANGLPLRYNLPVAVGNTLGPLLTVWLLRRLDFRPGFERRRDILFLGIAAGMGMSVTAINGVGWFLAAGAAESDDHLTEVLKWWVGDWMGVITTAPLLLIASRAQFAALTRRGVEFLLGFAAMGAILWIVFASKWASWSLAFVPLPLLAWAALRFGPAGTSLGLLFLAIGAAYTTSVGHGPFRQGGSIGGILVLWIYMVSATVLGWLITALHSQLLRDMAERKQAELRSASERTILETLATGAPLPEVLTTLTRSFGLIFPDTLCSVLLLDPATQQLRHGASANLPQEYCDSIDGTRIGPEVGSCGTAAFTQQTVIVEDIATDPLWDSCRHLALPYGLRACWSVPIMSSQGGVLGTFALYYRQPQRATAGDVAIVERGAHFAALAIERHQLLDSLRESQTRLETLIGNLPGIVFRCLNDEHWTLLYVSDHCEKITGYRRDELVQNRVASLESLIHPDDRAALRTNPLTPDGRPSVNEYRIIDRAGVEHWVSERAAGVFDSAGHLLYIDGFVQDITAARAAARDREEFSRKVLETQKLESLGVLAGGIAHDFNNILTAILGNASLAINDAEPGTMLHDCLEDISKASLRATELCTQMLAYSGKGRFIVQKLDLDQLIRETTQMLQLSISKRATLHFELEENLPPFEADATQIRQVIMNLVINASEAVGESSGSVTLRTGLTRLDRAAIRAAIAAPDAGVGDYVFLEVADNGCGMDPETQAKIFEPFFTTKFTGRGLGLAAVLGIVRGHRGALRVHSQPGQGTSFTLLFPASTGHAEATAEPPAKTPAWRGHGTVLVVDDEAPVRSTAARMLQAIGFATEVASDGRECVEIFRHDPTRYTAVLLDLTMPQLSGEQTFVELNRLRPGIPVVLMSGFSEQEAAHRFADIGLKNFLQKPFAVESLGEMLRAALA